MNRSLVALALWSLVAAMPACGKPTVSAQPTPSASASVSSAAASASAPAAPAPPDAVTAKAYLAQSRRTEQQGWVVVHLQGKAQERGFQHGSLLANEIKESLRVRKAIWQHDSGMDWEWLLEKVRTLFTPRVEGEILAEIDGIAQGAATKGVATNRDELVALNAWLEIAWYWWPEELKKIKGSAPSPGKESCSAFIATGSMTRDGHIVAGHNTWDFYPQADDFVILDIVPDKGHRILMQSQPGLVHSATDFFVTDAGLIGTETTIGGFEGYDSGGLPEFVRVRRAMQDASSIDEWSEILKKGNNGGYANAWLLGDVNSNEIARLELGLRNVHLEKTKDGYYVGSNLAENLRIARQETHVDDTDIRASGVARRVRWRQLMDESKGKIDRELGKKLLADHYDSWLHTTRPSNRTLCGHSDLDAFGFNPASAPYEASGAVDAKVVDSEMAKHLSFAARWGAPCGRPFDAPTYLNEHPEKAWIQSILKSRPANPWTAIVAQERQ